MLGGITPFHIIFGTVSIGAGQTSAPISYAGRGRGGLLIVGSSNTGNVEVGILGYADFQDIGNYSNIEINVPSALQFTIKNKLTNASDFYYKLISV